MDKFEHINVKRIDKNIFKLIDDRWMLITAGTKEKFNMMTASWGAFGILWNKPVAIIFIRHNRYTFEFVEKNEIFTLSFFPKRYKEVLKFCGTKSGKNYNKVEETGLNPLFYDSDGIYFKEANLVFVCKKLFSSDIKDNLPPEIINKHYTDKIFHRMFIGEIKNCYKKNED